MSCPSATTLSAWLDDELEAGEALLIRGHLESCAACREQVIGWMEAVNFLPPHPLGEACPEPGRRGRGEGQSGFVGLTGPEHESRARPTTCLDEETLVAYSEAELTAAEAALTEQHLRQCTHCVSEVQGLIQIRTAMESPPHKAEMGSLAEGIGVKARSSPLALWERARVMAQTLVGRLQGWLESIGRILVQPWPALGAVAATVLLVLVIVRLLPGGADVQFRGIPGPVKVEVIANSVIARARPSDAEPMVAALGRGTQATQLEQSGEWTRIELPDGRRVWVRSQAVTPLRGSTP